MESNVESMRPPVVWTVAGSDSGGGAGIQADLRAFDAFDVHGCSAVAAITAQNSQAVRHVTVLGAAVLAGQLDALADDLPPRAIKTGMLGSCDNLHALVACIDRLRREAPVAVVVDPVWRASTGAGLAEGDLRDAMLNALLPRATLATPNRAEAAWLLGWDEDALARDANVPAAAAELKRLTGCDVVITGGDAAGSQAIDWIETAQARGWLALPRQATPHRHGTGCVFAASAAAALAHGFCTADAAVWAKMATANALQRGYPAGAGAGPVRPGRGFTQERKLLPRLLGQFALPIQDANQVATDRATNVTTHSCAHDSTAGFAPLRDPWLGLYPIVDSAAWVERLIAAGVRTLQLRIKQAAQPDLAEQVRRSVQCARAAGVQLFINDHWQLAIDQDAYGVHLGQEDLAVADLAAIRQAGLRLGISSHSPWEVCRAVAWQPSYIACGPIHATTTKQMPWLPQGPGNLAFWCALLDVPVVAIAGMDAIRAAEAVRCGAAGVAVLRGIVQAHVPEGTVRVLNAAIAVGQMQAGYAPPAWPRPTLGQTLG